MASSEPKSSPDDPKLKKEQAKPALNPLFTAEQLQYIKNSSAERRALMVPTLLIVEDQEFSRKLLEGSLRATYECYSAVNAAQAVALYAEHVPCIVLLDIELPDMNGHDLAAFIKRHDPESFIVMVTANHYENDIKRAVENKVQGFVTKPFSKQKIVDCIDKYMRERKVKP